MLPPASLPCPRPWAPLSHSPPPLSLSLRALTFSSPLQCCLRHKPAVSGHTSGAAGAWDLAGAPCLQVNHCPRPPSLLRAAHPPLCPHTHTWPDPHPHPTELEGMRRQKPSRPGVPKGLSQWGRGHTGTQGSPSPAPGCLAQGWGLLGAHFLCSVGTPKPVLLVSFWAAQPPSPTHWPSSHPQLPWYHHYLL